MNFWDGGAHMAWMGIWWIVAVALIVAVVWSLRSSSRGGTRGASESPEEILKRRYASGEIDRETYHRMMKDVERGRP